MALDKVERQLNEIVSRNTTPKSIKNLQKELNNIANRQNDIELDLKTEKSEIKIHALKNEFEELNKKAEKLGTNLDSLMLNPRNTVEAKELQAKIDLINSRLEVSKNKANELKDKIKDNETGFKNADDKLKKFGSTLLSVFNKKNPLKSINKQFDGLNKKIGQLSKRITGLVTGALIFNVLSSGLSKLSTGLIGALNSNSQFASSLNQIKVNLLTAFAPIYNYVLPAINTLMRALSSITGQIATFVSGLFGKTTEQAKNSAKSIYNQSKAYQELGKSAKKTKLSLSSLDEVENLNDDDNSSSGSGGESAPSIDFSGEVEQSGKLLDYLNEIKKLIADGNFFGVGEKLASSVNNILNSIDVESFTGKIHNGLQSAVQFFNGFINEFDFSTLGTKVSQLLTGTTRAIADAIKSIEWESLGRGISDFITNIDWGQLGINIFDTIWNAISGIGTMLLAIDWGKISSAWSESVRQLWQHITQTIISVDWEKLGKDIITEIIDFISNLDWMGVTLDVMTAIASAIFACISLIIGAIEGIIDAILDFLGIHSPSTLFADIGTYLMEGLINGITSLKDAVVNIFVGIWDGIKNVFGHVTEWFGGVFSSAWQAVKNVFSTGGKIFDGIKNGILNGLKVVINGIIGGINKVISIPFNGINTALRKIKNISIIGQKPFYGLINTISVPQIPYLAKGAVIPPNAEFAAILGDQKHGRNLEAPENLIRQIVREEAGGMNTDLLIELNRNILALSNMCAVLNVDGIEMARALFRPLENERNRQQLSTTVVRS